MKIDVLRTFCDLVETGSFSKAAEANGISQPAVSQQLAGIEGSTGVCLANRGGGFTAPTDAGMIFYRGAKDILRRYDQIFAEIRSAENAVRGTLRVGTIYSVGFYLLAPYVRKFLESHPEVDLDVTYAQWHQITAAVLKDEMDLGIVAFPEKHRLLNAIPFAAEQMVLVCSPSHRLSSRKRIDPSDLKDERFIACEANVPTRRFIDRVLRRCHVDVNIVMEFDNIDTLKRAIEVGAGLSILPAENVKRETATGYLRSVPFFDPSKWVRKIRIIYRRGKTFSQAARMFFRILRSPA